MTDACPTCGESFKYYGQHWRQSNCPYPDLTEHQNEVIMGLLMGDGSLDRSENRNTSLQVEMIRKEYLNYLDSTVFGLLSTGVRMVKTAQESARENRERGFSTDANPRDYHDKYKIRTRRIPGLNQYTRWYKSGKKVFPREIDLTPTVLLHWYVGDGDYDTHGEQSRIRISTTNEIDNRNKIEYYFENGPGVEISNWSIWERKDGSKNGRIVFTRDETEKLFKYMSLSQDPTPLPGFEYKWPEGYK